jgi:uncharacterized cupredoxin-like copper-binding protein
MEHVRRPSRWTWAGFAVAPALLVGLLLGGGIGPTTAQEATPVAVAGRPAHIHTGTCPDVGDIVAPLIDLTAPTGEAVGQRRRAVTAETSFTSVPLTLDAILADDHAINVHLSAAEIGTYIACGDIGGVLDANGALVIGLGEQNNSGFTGIAYLVPGADGVSTDVSVFIASEEAAMVAATPAAAEEEEAPAAAGEMVDVSLFEWGIDMPTTLSAGTITFNVTNDGTLPHNFEVEGRGIEEELPANLEPGESGTLELTLEPGTYEVYCPVGEGSHRQQGMELELTVE